MNDARGIHEGEIEVELRRARGGCALPHAEPVSVGIPFAAGVLGDASALAVRDPAGAPLPSQCAPLELWPDGSVRWALVDFLARDSLEKVFVHLGGRGESELAHPYSLTVREHEDALWVDTGAARFEVRRNVFGPLRAYPRACAVTLRSHLVFRDRGGEILSPRLRRLEVEASGPVRVTLAGEGDLRPRRGRPLCRFAVRLSFFAGCGILRLEFRLHNPRRARHRGGRWDLGGRGSVLFRELSIELDTDPSSPSRLVWRPTIEADERISARVEIHQASSGGENWASRSHVDRSGRVPLPFRGCRIDDGARVSHLDRATPVVARIVGGARIGITLLRFWQQFPSALEGDAQRLRAGLFPRQCDELFELQGGERTTQTVFLQCEPLDGEGRVPGDLAWAHDPIVPVLAPEYYRQADALPYYVAAADDPHRDYLDLAAKALDGPHSFLRKREVIDEYGWRNFGDTWADHEDVHFDGPHPVVSHYNNQYDLVSGFLLHFARSGDRRWFELAADLARHVVDVDLYHCADDKPAYAGGLFWHTDHYDDAWRATHRSYSADSPRARRGPYGGGPSCENNYTTGLLHFHFLTGDPSARAAVLQLADWVLRMDDGGASLLACVDSGPSGLASCTRDFDYHGPGRGPGNSVNALLDAFRLAGARPYLAKAEELIRRCIHPDEDPSRWELLDADRRWSYLVFLQSLGKYLDLKCRLGERDAAFAYARASLARYAAWMAEKESPFATRFDRVEYPTESWPAQDVRKSCVFDYAAKYGPPESRATMTARAEYFFGESLTGVLSFPTHASTRALAVLLANGVQRAAFRLYPPAPVPAPDGVADFGPPSAFVPQKERVRRELRSPRGWWKLARAAARPWVWRRLLSGKIW